MKKYQKKNRRPFFAALVSMFAGAVFAVRLQFLKGDVLDYAVAGDGGSALRCALLLAGLILCECGCYYLDNRFRAKFVTGCTGALKHDIFESILSRGYVDYRSQPQGAYLARYTSEAEAIRDRRFRMIPMFWEILFKILFVSAALFLLDWRSALVTIGLLTTPLYIPKLIEKKLQKAQTDALKAAEQNLAKVTDWLMLRGEFSPGDFFVAIGMIDQLSWPLISLAGIIRQLIAIRPACEAMEEFLAVPEQAQTAGKRTFENEIRFRDVSFSYDGQRWILDGFNLTVEKGKRYLLKGPSGCGKTTAVNLLLGYYDVTGGSITIDGAALTDPYGLMTVVRQEAVLFRDTLRHNLTMYQDIPDERLMGVLKSVGLERFADSLDMEIAEGGANFSGGEKKRICLARALLRDRPVLILDEPLANLDAETAEWIEDLLLAIADKTILVVSHQFTESKQGSFDQVVNFTA